MIFLESVSLFVSDIKKQVHELSTSVYQIRGHIKGKTLLPFPQVSKHLSSKSLLIFQIQGAGDIDEEERKVRESDGEYCNMQLKNNIEGIIIKWAYQVILKPFKMGF